MKSESYRGLAVTQDLPNHCGLPTQLNFENDTVMLECSKCDFRKEVFKNSEINLFDKILGIDPFWNAMNKIQSRSQEA